MIVFNNIVRLNTNNLMIRELAHATRDYIPTLFATKNLKAFKVCMQ
jgi:hypothetical protein